MIYSAKTPRGFQSTSPVWGMTFLPPDVCADFAISIHIPRVGDDVKKGTKFRATDSEDADLYTVIQPELTIQEHYPPGTGTESMYTRIDEKHDGTKYDPIPYDGNMALVSGLYYTQGGVLYLCNRDTVNPVYHALSELVGLYVEVAE